MQLYVLNTNASGTHPASLFQTFHCMFQYMCQYAKGLFQSIQPTVVLGSAHVMYLTTGDSKP